MTQLMEEEQSKTQRKLQSDSDSEASSEEDKYFDEYMQGQFQRKVASKRGTGCAKFMMGCCIGVCFFIVLSFFVVALRNYLPNTKIQQKPNISEQKSIKDQQIAKKNKNMVKNERQIVKKTQSMPTSDVKKVFKLPDLGQTIQMQGIYFNKSDILKKANHWYSSQRNVVCIPQYIVNSAIKISSNFYIQATPYQNVNVALYNVTIPAQNIYRMEPARQFLDNVSLTFPQFNVVFDRPHPLLLALAGRYFRKGFYVTDGFDWQLIQLNLVLNDLYLMASPQPREQLLASNVYKVLVSSNMSLVVDLLVYKKKQLTVVIELSHPTSIKTAYLLKMKIYKLSQGFQCSKRTMQLHEQGVWRINDQAFLIPGWYVFTNPDNDISFGTQHIDYEHQLIRQSIFCENQDQAIIQNGYFRGSKRYYHKMGYSQLYLFGSSKKEKINNFRQIYAYLKDKNIKGSVLLDSGPLQYLLVAVASISHQAQITINQDYLYLRQLRKHLVVNNLQRVKIAKQKDMQQVKYELVVTNNQNNIEKLSGKQYLYYSEQYQSDPVNRYRYTFLKENGCKMASRHEFVASKLKRGVYQVEKVLQ